MIRMRGGGKVFEHEFACSDDSNTRVRGTVGYEFRFLRSARRTENSLEHLVFVHNNRPSCRRRRWTCDVEKQARKKIRLKNKTIIKWNARNTYIEICVQGRRNKLSKQFICCAEGFVVFLLFAHLSLYLYLRSRAASKLLPTRACVCCTHTLWSRERNSTIIDCIYDFSLGSSRL